MNCSDLLFAAILVGALGSAGCDQGHPVSAGKTGSAAKRAQPLERDCAQMSDEALQRCQQNVEAIRNVTAGGLLNLQ